MIYILSAKGELFLSLKNDADIFSAINSTLQQYPEQAQKYYSGGIKIIKAESILQAKKLAQQINTIKPNGQISFL